MPQLDPTTFISQLFWLAVTFTLLYVVVLRSALPRISEVLESRQNKIDDDLKKAAARKEEAESVLAEYEQAMAEARSKGLEVLQQAKEEVSAESDRRSAELGAKLAEQSKEAEARIAAARDEALKNLQGPVADLVATATSKLIGMSPAEDQVKGAVAKVTGGGS